MAQISPHEYPLCFTLKILDVFVLKEVWGSFMGLGLLVPSTAGTSFEGPFRGTFTGLNRVPAPGWALRSALKNSCLRFTQHWLVNLSRMWHGTQQKRIILADTTSIVHSIYRHAHEQTNKKCSSHLSSFHVYLSTYFLYHVFYIWRLA